QEHVNLMSAEAARFHAPWLTQYRDQYHFKTVAMLEAGEALGDEAIATGQARQAGLRAELEELMAQHEIDFWIAPAAQGPAPAGLDATGDPVMNLPWTCSGLPSLTIPTGINNEGLPLGLQLVGKHGYDEELMVYGQQLDDLLSIHG
ncbi:MAG: hypothetical protein KDE59_20525, partial [Anaerolineales bacterium]|nr:hypothetical protein [Anaerolineales bacterium]